MDVPNPRRSDRWVHQPILVFLLMIGLGLGFVPASTLSQVRAQDLSDEPLESAEVEAAAILRSSVYVDPVAEDVIKNQFRQLFSNVNPGVNSFGVNNSRILNMAVGRGQINGALIDRFVEYSIRELTDPDNIEAVRTQGQVNQNRIERIEDAGVSLITPYRTDPDQADPRFFQIYNDKLLQVAPEVLSNHLYARVQLMQAMVLMEDPKAIDQFTEIIESPEQPVVVKMLAAEGIERIGKARASSIPLPARERAASALLALIQDNPDIFWLAQAEALDAVGSMRQIYEVQDRASGVYGTEVFKIMINPQYRPDVRARAALALSRFQIPADYTDINYTLPVYHIGRLAELVGRRTTELFNPTREDYDPERGKYFVGLLVTQLFPAMDGDSEYRGSGVANFPSLGKHTTYVRSVQQRIRALTVAAVNLAQSAGSQVENARITCLDRVSDLADFLDQNPPTQFQLLPGGPEFPLQPQ